MSSQIKEQEDKPMSAVTAFTFEGSHEVRTMTRRGEPWFVLNDVCGALGIGNSRMTADRLENDEKDGVSLTDAIGRQQNTTIVNEPGLYRIIMRSDKPQARRFQKWVFTDVLPAIRKTGRYEAKDAMPVKRLPHRKPDGSRDRLSFTARDAHGALINWRVPSHAGDWHEHVRIGEQWFGEIVELAKADPKAAFIAMRQAGPAIVQNIAGGHETGFFRWMSAYAMAGILQNPDGPVLPFDLPDLGKEPSVSMAQFLARAAPVQPARRSHSTAEQDARDLINQHRGSGITRMELRRRMRELGYGYPTISDAISRLFCMGWASVDKSGFIRAAA